jgi:hypothetical protein
VRSSFRRRLTTLLTIQLQIDHVIRQLLERPQPKKRRITILVGRKAEAVQQILTDEVIVKYEANIPSPLPTRNSSLLVIKSRKENKQQSPNIGEKLGSLDATRKVSQTLMSNAGGDTKRQRIVTPAAFKVIDEEDEPKTSPTRKNFQTAPVQEGERRVLSGIEVNIL